MASLLTQNAAISDISQSARYPSLLEAQEAEMQQVRQGMEKVQQHMRELRQAAAEQQSRAGSVEPLKPPAAETSEIATEPTSGPDTGATPNLRRRKR